MATTTPNFGWPVPTSTDLVKDGAVAIEGLGDAIDASLLDLKGGTTGQVLSKASNTDMDFTWATDASGIPATIFDAKGDIIAASAADTAARLAVGANNTVLTADSSTATGLKWAASSSGALTKITSASFSAVSDTGTTFDGIFSSTYANYVVVFQGFSSVDEAQLHMQTRAGSTTQTGTDYYGGRWWVGYNASTEATATSSQTKWSPMKLRTSGNGRALLNMNFSNVGTGSSVFPVFNGTAGGGWLAGAWLCGGSFLTGAHNATGLIFSASSGTITGTVYVYGVQN